MWKLAVTGCSISLGYISGNGVRLVGNGINKYLDAAKQPLNKKVEYLNLDSHI